MRGRLARRLGATTDSPPTGGRSRSACRIADTCCGRGPGAGCAGGDAPGLPARCPGTVNGPTRGAERGIARRCDGGDRCLLSRILCSVRRGAKTIRCIHFRLRVCGVNCVSMSARILISRGPCAGGGRPHRSTGSSEFHTRVRGMDTCASMRAAIMPTLSRSARQVSASVGGKSAPRSRPPLLEW